MAPPDVILLTVGSSIFRVPASLAAAVEPGSVLADSLREATSGGTVVVHRAAHLFSQILDFLDTGVLPNDTASLRDLYVESAFWRLAKLRDAIEAALIVSSAPPGAPPPAPPLLQAPPSAAAPRGTATLVAAATAIGKAGAVRRAFDAQRAKPRSPPMGLTTAEYVGGSWRELYATGASGASRRDTLSSTLAAAASRTVSAPGATSSRRQSSGSAFSAVGETRTTVQEPWASPTRATFDSVQRSAAETALPDPFGFTRPRASVKLTATIETQVPPQPQSRVPDALAASIASLAPPADDARSCVAAMTALNSLLQARAAMRADQDGDAEPGGGTSRGTQALASRPAINAASPGRSALIAARALLAALEAEEEDGRNADAGAGLGSLTLSPSPPAAVDPPEPASAAPSASESAKLEDVSNATAFNDDDDLDATSAMLAAAASEAALSALKFGAAAAQAAVAALSPPAASQPSNFEYLATRARAASASPPASPDVRFASNLTTPLVQSASVTPAQFQ